MPIMDDILKAESKIAIDKENANIQAKEIIENAKVAGKLESEEIIKNARIEVEQSKNNTDSLIANLNSDNNVLINSSIANLDNIFEKNKAECLNVMIGRILK